MTDQLKFSLETKRDIQILYTRKGLDYSAKEVIDKLNLPCEEKDLYGYLKDQGITKRSDIYPSEDIEVNNYSACARALDEWKNPSVKASDLLERDVTIRRLQKELRDSLLSANALESKLGDMENTFRSMLHELEIPKEVLYPVRSKDTDGCSLIYCISDLHIGAYDKYNSTTQFDSRWDEIVQGMMAERYYVRPKEIAISILGDIFEAPTLANVKQHCSVDLTTSQAMRNALKHIEGLILSVWDKFRVPIRIYGIGGNHDRLSKGSSEDIERTAFLMFMLLLETALRPLLASGAVSIEWTENKWMAYTIDNTRVIQWHGDGKPNTSRIKTLDRQEYEGTYPEYLLMLQGHFHSTKVVPLYEEHGREMIVTAPSIKGRDNYALGLGFASRRAQSIIEIGKFGPQPPKMYFATC